MEQVGYLASKLSSRIFLPPTTAASAAATTTRAASYGDSWEEQAFAEDASGVLGGCTWPPRSYNCSFCRREFRSAQALGGHMNVHRRDRARLRQTPALQTHHPLVLNPCKSFDFRHYDPSQFHDDQIYTLFCNSTESDCDPVFRVSDQNQKASSKKRVFSHRSKEEEDEDEDKEDEECLVEDLPESCKRRKIDANPLILLQLSPVIDKCCHPQLEMHKLCCSSIEELDLELRLGVK